MLSVIFVEFHK